MKQIRLYIKIITVVAALALGCIEAQGVTATATRDRQFRVINTVDGLADNSAQTIRCTFSGRMVVSTIGHINFFDGSGFTHISAGDKYYPLPAYHGHYHLYFDDTHHLWLKDSGRVTCVDLMTEQFVEDIEGIFRSQGIKGQVEDMFIDSSGRLWLVQKGRIYSRKGKMVIPLRKGRQLQDLEISGNNVYLFYDDSKVDAYDCNSLKKLYTSEALSPERAEEFAKLSVVTKYKNGFFQIRNGNNKAVMMWFDVNSRKWRTLLDVDYYLSNMTMKDDVLYIASAYGYWTYDIRKDSLEHIEYIKMSDGRDMLTDMNCIEFDRQGGMWIGTEKRGLLYSKYINTPFKVITWADQKAIEYWDMMDKVCDNKLLVKGYRLNCTYKDSRNWIWVGSQSGLYYFKPGEKDSICIRRKDGMMNSVVHSIIEDGKHNMWVSTSNGIVGIVIKGGKVTFVNSFISSDGIPPEVFVNGRAMTLPDGTVVMQSLDHVVTFNPMTMSIMESNNILLHPKLVRLQVNGTNVLAGTEIDGKVVTDKAISRLNTIELSSTQNSLSLKFSALNYFRPIQTYYRYRVGGLQNEWHMLSYYNSRGLVDKTGILHLPLVGLKPGTYIVEVQASMYPEKWNTPPTKIVIRINEPWWRTTGLSMLVVVVFLVLLIWNIVVFSRNSRLKMKRNVSEMELFNRVHGFISRAEACRQELQCPKEYDDDENNTEVSSGTDIDDIAVDLLMELMPYSKNGEIDHVTLVQICLRRGIKLTELFDILTSNIFRNPRLLTMAMLLENAAHQLRETDMTVEEISEKNNFYSPNFFIASFFRRYGMTPAQWRKDSGERESSQYAASFHDLPPVGRK